MVHGGNRRAVAGWIGCLAMSAVMSTGCSKGSSVDGTVPVTGKVTYNGQPVAGASVLFVSGEDRRAATAVSDADGSYRLTTLNSPGALPGAYVVIVRKTETPVDLTKEVSMDEAAAQAAKPLPAPKELLPAKYGDSLQSPLKFEVKLGSDNNFDLALTD